MANRAMSWLGVSLAAVSLASCGGSGGDDRASVQVPSPTPTPTPPAPTPTPTFTPNPSRVLGQAGIGQSVTGPVACAGATLNSDAAGRVNEIASLDAAALGTAVIEVRAVDTYALTINGAAGPVFDPAEKASGPTRAYDYFRDGDDEIELYRGALGNEPFFGTLGRYSSSGASDRLCFFAAGGPGSFVSPAAFIPGRFPFSGIADGIAQIGGTFSRLFGSGVEATVDYRQGAILLTLDLKARTPVFGEVADANPSDLPSATGVGVLNANGSFQGTITATSGLSGTFQGQLFDNSPTSLVLSFQMRQVNGNQVFGAAALDAEL